MKPSIDSFTGTKIAYEKEINDVRSLSSLMAAVVAPNERVLSTGITLSANHSAGCIEVPGRWFEMSKYSVVICPSHKSSAKTQRTVKELQ